MEPILRGEAEFVTASRFKDPALVPVMPPMKRWGNDVIARWISRIIGKKFDDVSCGFRAYSRNAYLRLVLLGAGRISAGDAVLESDGPAAELRIDGAGAHLHRDGDGAVIASVAGRRLPG